MFSRYARSNYFRLIKPTIRCIGAIPFPNSSTISPNEILSLEEYKKIRSNVLKQQADLRKRRKIHIGPYASLMFENYELMWSQVHEMLFIESCSPIFDFEEQKKDEIEAYDPLVPKGKNIVCTLMFEIDKKERRDKILFELGHVEDSLSLSFKNHSITAVSASQDDIDRTTADGKTSSIHFLTFNLNDEQAKEFKEADSQNEKITIQIGHKNYPHSVVLSESIVKELQNDIKL